MATGNDPGVLRLSDEAVGWLRSCIPGQVDSLDLHRAYAFEHELNAYRELERQHVTGDRELLWRLIFFDANRQAVLEEASPLARKIVAAQPYWGRRGRGPIAFNAQFALREACKRRGFATTVYIAERELLARWGIREIQMLATGDGPAVWMRRCFGFRPKDAGALEERYVAWAARRDVPHQPPTDPADYPLDFLRTLSELFLYRALP